ncbi:MAG: PD-(D/E)XK nuclease family protein, partial [Syntrophothermus sp.]
KPEPGDTSKPSTPVVERLVEALGVERDADATVTVAAPRPRPGLEADFGAAEIGVRVNLPSPARAAELTGARPEAAAPREAGEGPPPLVRRRPPTVPARPLSYTAISAYEECSYRFYMERVLGLPPHGGGSSRHSAAAGEGAGGSPSAREERTARGAAVHALLEWSREQGWREPTPELARRHALAAGLDLREGEPEALLAPVRGWLDSPLRRRIEAEATRVRAEVPILLGLGETVLRGSIDLLVERGGRPPLVVDYKTDRLAGSHPASRAPRYETQRAIYALAASEALAATEVEVAYVFLERPEEPVATTLDGMQMTAARQHLETTVRRIAAGEFPVAAGPRRGWDLCRGCPALSGLCSGPAQGD